MRAEFRAEREVVMRVRESLSGVMWNWFVVSEMSWVGEVLVKVFVVRWASEREGVVGRTTTGSSSKRTMLGGGGVCMWYSFCLRRLVD